MAITTEHLTPSNHLPLEPTGLTPISVVLQDFSPLNSAISTLSMLDFRDATGSPFRVEQPRRTPPLTTPLPLMTLPIPELMLLYEETTIHR